MRTLRRTSQLPPPSPPASLPKAPALRGAMQDLTWHELAKLTPKWEQLSLSHSDPEPFFQPYWILAFSAMLSPSKRAVAITAQSESKLAGILPLTRELRFFGGLPVRTLRSLSGTHSCRFDVLCDEKEERLATRAIWDSLHKDHSWDIIEALNVPPNSTFEALQECAQTDGFLVAQWPTLRMPYLDLPSSNRDPFSNSPKEYRGFRSRLEKSHQKLSQTGELTLRVETDLTKQLFDEFLELEARGWKKSTGGAIAQNPRVRQFYLRALYGASRAGHLRMYSLRLNGAPVAMELGLQLNNRYYSPKATYDESFARFSPGHLLTRLIISDLVAHGVSRYDFLGPRARHKYVWTETTRDHAHRYIIRPSLRGRLAHSILVVLAPSLKRIKYACFGDPQEPEAKLRRGSR